MATDFRDHFTGWAGGGKMSAREDQRNASQDLVGTRGKRG
jgi:hypothetical protein